MNKRSHDGSSDFLLGAVARNVQKLPEGGWLLSETMEMTSVRRLPDGPGIAEACRLPARWVQSLHEEAERWDGLA